MNSIQRIRTTALPAIPQLPARASTTASPSTPASPAPSQIWGPQTTTLRVPLNSPAGTDKATDALRQHGNPVATGLNAGKVDWVRLGKEGDVAQLDKAEALAQEAYRRATAAGTNDVEKLRAQEEFQEAEKLRASVSSHLTPLQQAALEKIEKLESRSMDRVLNPRGGFLGAGDAVGAMLDMQRAASESQSLDQWILGS